MNYSFIKLNFFSLIIFDFYIRVHAGSVKLIARDFNVLLCEIVSLKANSDSDERLLIDAEGRGLGYCIESSS